MHYRYLLATVVATLFLSIILTTSPPAIAVSPPVDADVTFSVEFNESDSYEFLEITRDDEESVATIDGWAYASNMSVWIYEENVASATVDFAGIFEEYNLTEQQVSDYLGIVGRLTVIVSGEGTDTLILIGMPDIYRVYVDDVAFTNYTLEDGVFTISMEMSEHEIVLDFTTAEQINSVTNLMIEFMIPTVLIVAVVGMVVKGVGRLK